MTDERRHLLVRRLVVAEMLDGLTFAAFAILIGFHGQLQEMNPLVATIYVLAGVQGLVLVKLGAAGLMEWRARRPLSAPVTHRAYWPVWTVLLATATASGIVGTGFNLASLIRAA